MKIIKTIIMSALILALLSMSVSAIEICGGLSGACTEAHNLTLAPDPVTNNEDLTLSGYCDNTGQTALGISVVANVNGVIYSNIIVNPVEFQMYDVLTIPHEFLNIGDVVTATLSCPTVTPIISVQTLSRTVIEGESQIEYVQPPVNDSDFVFYHESSNITVSFMTTNNVTGKVMPLQSPIGLETFFEEQTGGGVKYSYELFLPNPKFVAVNRIDSSAPITFLGDYDANLGGIISLSYTDAVLEGFNVTIQYNESISPIHQIDVIMWKDYMGASKLIIDPEVCVPNWIPSAYGDCQINDSKQAISYVDSNSCGLSFNGTYEWYACDYCTPDWSCSDLSTTECVSSNYKCDNVSDSNTCFATTGSANDMFWGDLNDYNSGYCNTYDQDDVAPIVMDGIGILLVTIISLLGIIVVVFGYNWTKKQIK